MVTLPGVILPGEERPWPTYDVGPLESILAIGVISVNYGGLETAFEYVFGNIVGTDLLATSSVFNKLSNDERAKTISEILPQRELSDELTERVSHFTDGVQILAFNRGLIMHSTIGASGPTQDIFLKTQRNGKTVGCGITLGELRTIADTMRDFRIFGRALASCIVDELGNRPASWRSPLPDKPPIPPRLRYTDEEIPIR